MSESGSKALHFVSAWATEHRLVLAQQSAGRMKLQPSLPGIA